jgi:hypothetical protein
MRLAEDDHMVKTLASCRTDQPLHMCILPWRAWRDWSVSDAEPAQTPLHYLAIDGVTVAYEISWCFLPRNASTICRAIHSAVGRAVSA